MTINLNGRKFDPAKGLDIFTSILDSRGELRTPEETEGETVEDDADALELKGLIRRVRSAAGARRFGQPIGSIIKIDVEPAGRLEMFGFGVASAHRWYRPEDRDAYIAALRKRWPKPGKKNPLERESVDDNFVDLYEGIRNWDFEVPGEEVDWDSDLSRARNARREAEELGVEVHGRGQIDYVETGLAAMRTYQEMFPGIQYYVNRLSFERLRPGCNGENRMHTNYGDDGKAFSGNTIIMSGRAWNRTDWEIEDFARTHDMSNHYSTRMDQSARAMDTELWRSAFLKTFNHEMGHTFARVLFGHFVGENETQEQRDARREYAFEQMEAIYREFGIDWKAPGPSAIFGGTDDQNSQVFRPTGEWTNHEEIRDVLSAYGTTNVHETMAEAWVEYITDPEPRAFARALGALMEDMMNEFLDQDGAR